MAGTLLLASCTAKAPNDDQGAGARSNAAGGALAGGAGGALGPTGGTANGGAANGGAAGSLAGGATGGGASGGGAAGSSGGSAGSAGGDSGAVSNLPAPPGPADVPKPAGAVGGLQVLNWAGFKAAVSYTFDDSNSSQIEYYDELAALGVRFTFYLQTNKAEAQSPVWAQAAADGHELGNHSMTHAMAASGSDVDAATTFLEDTFGVNVWTMAAPYGDASYIDVAETRFLINRGVANGLIGANDDTDPFSLNCYLPPTGASQAEMDAQVTEARDAGKWRVVLVHGFTGGTDGAYQPVDFEEFSASVSASKAHGDVWIDSVVNVGAYWRGQKIFSQVTPTTAGDEQTWTWTLPDHFPPEKYLRVTVTGGTLSQNGSPLPWDGHGYYEVALDAGTLTLSP